MKEQSNIIDFQEAVKKKRQSQPAFLTLITKHPLSLEERDEGKRRSKLNQHRAFMATRQQETIKKESTGVTPVRNASHELKIQDPQINDEFYILDPGTIVTRQTKQKLRYILEDLPYAMHDELLVEVRPYVDDLANYTEVVFDSASFLEEDDYYGETNETVFMNFRHARALAQIGLLFDVLPIETVSHSQMSSEMIETSLPEGKPQPVVHSVFEAGNIYDQSKLSEKESPRNRNDL